MDKRQQEVLYHNIMALHDCADHVLDVVEHNEDEEEQELQIEMVEPFIHQLNRSADELGEALINYVEGGGVVRPEDQQKAQHALQEAFNQVWKVMRQLEHLSSNQQ